MVSLLKIRPPTPPEGNDRGTSADQDRDTVRCSASSETLVVRAFYGTSAVIAICENARGDRVKIEIGRLIRIG